MTREDSFIVRLQSAGQDIATVTLAPGCSEVFAGRSHTCALRTPADDHSVSGRHARLFWKGNALWLEDVGSRNGVYYRNVRLTKPHKVKSGDLFAIGNNSLICERINNPVQGKGKHKWHRLEYLNGDKAGRQIDICPKQGEETFTVGLDPANALVLPDMLVSRRHAFFETKENGECWLHDCGSRNGTYVNGEPLRGKERLLKDNDKISIAYFDFRFLDRTVVHTRFFLWLKIFVVAATLCVMAAVYVAWTTASSSVEDYMRLARQHAAEENFDAAHEVLVQARLVRNASDYRPQIDVLDGQLDRWAHTVAEWKRAQKELESGRLKKAQKALDPIVNAAVDAWIWNGTSAIEQKSQAEFAMSALRVFYEAQDALSEAEDGIPEQQADHIRVAEQQLASFLKERQADLLAHAYLANVKMSLTGTLARMESIRKGFESVDGAIAKLDALNPNFADLAVRLDKVARDKTQHRAVRAYADKYKSPCLALAETKRFIGKEFDDLNAMKFRDVQARDSLLQLPPAELCGRHEQLSNHRAKLEGHHRDAQKLAYNLESIVSGLAEKGITNGTCGASVRRILDTGLWQEALTFSCFKGKPPTPRRKSPVGTYDELLGVDYTFKSLQVLPQNYDGQCLKLIGFSPDCVEARTAFERLSFFVAFVESRPAWLRRGELGGFYAHCRALLEARDKLIAYLESVEGSMRARLVARYYVGYFSKTFSDEQRRALEEDFKALQKEIMALNEKYEVTSNPMEQIAIRKKILDIGIPGDPKIHPKWVALFEGGGL